VFSCSARRSGLGGGDGDVALDRLALPLVAGVLELDAHDDGAGGVDRDGAEVDRVAGQRGHRGPVLDGGAVDLDHDLELAGVRGAHAAGVDVRERLADLGLHGLAAVVLDGQAVRDGGAVAAEVQEVQVERPGVVGVAQRLGDGAGGDLDVAGAAVGEGRAGTGGAEDQSGRGGAPDEGGDETVTGRLTHG